MEKAYLVLEDGTVFAGKPLGKRGTIAGEVVFNTSMTGYQEILTDPSYAGQIVTMTYPLIGNYGTNEDDMQSRRVWASGFIVREACPLPSNFRAKNHLDDFLLRWDVIGIEGIDTRELTRKLRSYGVMMGAISSEMDPDSLLKWLSSQPRYDDQDFVRYVTTPQPFIWQAEGEEKYRLAILDCGVKYNIPRIFAKLGCRSTIYPAFTKAEEILSQNYDGIVFSPGPGDPAKLGYVIETIKKLIGKKPILGICLGHQLLGWALGGKTFKLKFGHRGGNHPVKDLRTGRVHITSQNHGYAVDPDSLKDSGAVVTHINLNDGTVEGLSHPELRIMSTQYHPEAAPGPRDNVYIFSEFLKMIEEGYA
ncbi:MAG: glutamine-hydrolyzing carbamoyl-phosphate synthase small subunit [bacterium]